MGGFFGDVVRSITGRDDDDKDLTNLGLSMIPGVGSYIGGQEANQANAQQAQQQMDFQERMSSTAHQREVEDLRKAGLNPLLSAGGTGASTPAGAQAVMQNVFDKVSTGAQEALQLALAAKKQKAETELMEAQKNKTKTEEKVISKGIPEAEIKNDFYDTIRPFIKKMKSAVQDVSKPWQQKDIKVGGKK